MASYQKANGAGASVPARQQAPERDTDGAIIAPNLPQETNTCRAGSRIFAAAERQGRESGKPIACSPAVKPSCRTEVTPCRRPLRSSGLYHSSPHLAPRYLRVFCDGDNNTAGFTDLAKHKRNKGPQFLPFSPALISTTPRPGLLAPIKRRGQRQGKHVRR
jgi:hypothetical protein